MQITKAKLQVLGREIEISKLAIYTDLDGKGNIFYKIEGQNQTGKAGIRFIYNKEKAIEAFTEIAKDVLTQQTLILEREMQQ